MNDRLKKELLKKINDLKPNDILYLDNYNISVKYTGGNRYYISEGGNLIINDFFIFKGSYNKKEVIYKVYCEIVNKLKDRLLIEL